MKRFPIPSTAGYDGIAAKLGRRASHKSQSAGNRIHMLNGVLPDISSWCARQTKSPRPISMISVARESKRPISPLHIEIISEFLRDCRCFASCGYNRHREVYDERIQYRAATR
jgi:hypothetical protein